MHAMGIHSALAIKRQRKRRDDQKKARERRYSIQSTESGDTGHSPHGSTRRKHRHQYGGHPDGNNLDSKVSSCFFFQYSSGFSLHYNIFCYDHAFYCQKH